MTADLDGRFEDAEEDLGSNPDCPVPRVRPPDSIIRELPEAPDSRENVAWDSDQDDENYDDDYELNGGRGLDRGTGGTGPAALKANRCQPTDQRLRQKYENRINLRAYEAPQTRLSGSALNPVFEQHRKADKER